MNTRHTPANVKQEVLTRHMNDKLNNSIPATRKGKGKKALYITLGWIIGMVGVITALGACDLIPKD